MNPPTAAAAIDWTALTTMVSVIVGFLTLVVTNIFALLHQKKAAAAAAVTAATTTVKLDQVHTLVNSRLGVVLSSYAATLSALAKQTGNPEDVLRAVCALKVANDHDAQQTEANAQAAAALAPAVPPVPPAKAPGQ